MTFLILFLLCEFFENSVVQKAVHTRFTVFSVHDAVAQHAQTALLKADFVFGNEILCIRLGFATVIILSLNLQHLFGSKPYYAFNFFGQELFDFYLLPLSLPFKLDLVAEVQLILNAVVLLTRTLLLCYISHFAPLWQYNEQPVMPRPHLALAYDRMVRGGSSSFLSLDQISLRVVQLFLCNHSRVPACVLVRLGGASRQVVHLLL